MSDQHQDPVPAPVLQEETGSGGTCECGRSPDPGIRPGGGCYCADEPEETGTLDCEHCPDGHRRPGSKPMYVAIGPGLDSDGQPTHLRVGYTNGHHVSEHEVQWLRDLIAAPKQEETGTREMVRVISELLEAADDCLDGYADALAGRDGRLARRGDRYATAAEAARELLNGATAAASLPSGDGERRYGAVWVCPVCCEQEDESERAPLCGRHDQLVRMERVEIRAPAPLWPHREATYAVYDERMRLILGAVAARLSSSEGGGA